MRMEKFLDGAIGVAELSLNGLALDGSVDAGKYTHYKFDLDRTDSILAVELETHSGDPDIFLSNKGIPTLSDFVWASSGVGDDRIVIYPKVDQCMVKGTYFVSVYSQIDSTFSIRVTLNTADEGVISDALRNVHAYAKKLDTITDGTLAYETMMMTEKEYQYLLMSEREKIAQMARLEAEMKKAEKPIMTKFEEYQTNDLELERLDARLARTMASAIGSVDSADDYELSGLCVAECMPTFSMHWDTVYLRKRVTKKMCGNLLRQTMIHPNPLVIMRTQTVKIVWHLLESVRDDSESFVGILRKMRPLDAQLLRNPRKLRLPKSLSIKRAPGATPQKNQKKEKGRSKKKSSTSTPPRSIEKKTKIPLKSGRKRMSPAPTTLASSANFTVVKPAEGALALGVGGTFNLKNPIRARTPIPNLAKRYAKTGSELNKMRKNASRRVTAIARGHSIKASLTK